ncbi:MAG: HNH endonuclease signature motif containing protein, partial [Acidimicrobiales bacterium]
ASTRPDELHRRQHRAREFRHWRDAEGMIRVAGALPPEVGVPLMNRLDTETDRIRRATKDPEPRTAHAADALVAMLRGDGTAKRGSTDLVLVCDIAAFRRGHAHEREPCHIVGGGPVPVPVVRRLAADAFVKVLLHDGVRIDTVAHLGRHIPAELRTALELGQPPHFDGVECVEPGCGRRYGLEWDHVDPVAHGGPTSYDNLRARCWPHHRAKTERDRAAGLLGPPP